MHPLFQIPAEDDSEERSGREGEENFAAEELGSARATKANQSLYREIFFFTLRR